MKILEKRTEELQYEKVGPQQDIIEFLSSVRRGEVKEKLVIPSGMIVEVPAKITDWVKVSKLMGKRYVVWIEHRNVTAVGLV